MRNLLSKIEEDVEKPTKNIVNSSQRKAPIEVTDTGSATLTKVTSFLLLASSSYM